MYGILTAVVTDWNLITILQVIVITHLAGSKCFNVRATLKHAKPAQCVITILVLSRTSNQAERGTLQKVSNKFLTMHT